MKKALVTLCMAVILTAFCLGAVGSTAAETADGAEVAALSAEEDKLAAALSVVYKRAGDVVLSIPYASINLSQTALMKLYSGEQTDALLYLNTHADTELQNAYTAMDKALSDFDKVLKKYSVPSGHAYRQKRTELETTFTGLKSACTELIRRTRTLIAGEDSAYDSYYTAYCEQVLIVSERFQAASTKIETEYDSLMSGLLGSDYSTIA